MKRTFMKRITAFLLALISILVMCPTAATAAGGEETVATVTYFCLTKSPGHCWIYVENLTDDTMQIGAYELKSGEGVSIGTFGITRYDGYGIYYNLEAYCQTRYGMSGYRTMTENLTQDELDTLHNGIKNYKNSWNIFRNCIAFANKMWNLVSDKRLSNLIFPAFTGMQMSLKGCQRDSVVQMAVTEAQVYRQKGNGDSAYLVNVSKASLGNLR